MGTLILQRRRFLRSTIHLAYDGTHYYHVVPCVSVQLAAWRHWIPSKEGQGRGGGILCRKARAASRAHGRDGLRRKTRYGKQDKSQEGQEEYGCKSGGVLLSGPSPPNAQARSELGSRRFKRPGKREDGLDGGSCDYVCRSREAGQEACARPTLTLPPLTFFPCFFLVGYDVGPGKGRWRRQSERVAVRRALTKEMDTLTCGQGSQQSLEEKRCSSHTSW